MTKRIFKYVLEIKGLQTISLPIGAQILSFQFQNRFPVIWAIVDEGAGTAHHTFRIYGTGHPMDEDAPERYVGTAQDGALVWHLFERVA